MDSAAAKPRKSDRTRDAILAAARELFAAHGYERTTVRDIAARAAIDPAMVIRYFGGKDALFALAAMPDLRLPDLRATRREDIGATLVRHFLGLWDGDVGMTVLLRSAASNALAAERMREIFASQVMPALARAGAGADAPARAGLVASQLLGLALGRFVLKLPPLVDMPGERIVAEVGPTIQAYLTGARRG